MNQPNRSFYGQTHDPRYTAGGTIAVLHQILEERLVAQSYISAEPTNFCDPISPAEAIVAQFSRASGVFCLALGIAGSIAALLHII